MNVVAAAANVLVRARGASLWRSGRVAVRACSWVVVFFVFFIPVVAQGQSGSTVVPSAATEAKRILIVMEEDTTWPAFRLISENLQNTLRRGVPGGIVVFAEHLDLAHFADPALRVQQASLVQKKYASTNLDLVIAVGDVPLDLFPQVPLLSLNADPSGRTKDAGSGSNVAGIVRVVLDAQGTLDIAKRLQPMARRIVAIGDGASGSGANVIGELEAAHPAFVGALPIKYLKVASVPAICDEVGALDRNSIVIYTALSKDEHGHPLIPGQVLAQIAAKSSAPVFVTVDSMIGTGAVGGYVTSFAKVGEVGGELGLRVLEGERPKDVNVSSVYVFDARQLHRWNIAESSLPAGSVILYGRPSFWELHRYYLVIGGLLLLAQAFLVFAWLRQKLTRRRVERALLVNNVELQKSGAVLLESEERFLRMANAAPVLMWMSGTDKLCTFFNDAWLGFTGRPLAVELGNGWTSGVHPEDLERCIQTYSNAFDSRASFEMEYRLKRSDGLYRWILDIGAARFDSQGTFLGYIGSCIDVTDRKNAERSLEEFGGRLIAGQEAERTRIARDLHDDISQRLALLGIGLGRLWKKRPESEDDTRAMIQELWDRTKELSSDVHRLSHQLHSSKLEHVGLGPALSGLCDELSEKCGIHIEFAEIGLSSQLRKDAALSLFRVAQEALSNVMKYSGASSALVELNTNETETRLRVVDGGLGFDPAQKKADTGIGLVSMRERLRLVGGALSVRSAPMAGTEIVAAIPLHLVARDAKTKRQTAGGYL